MQVKSLFKPETTEQFLERGGKINQVEEGKKSFESDWLRNCDCGCEGDYTDHSMRKGEKGQY